ncbi:MAG: putative DNA-binding domain-containing protein [Vicinamibacterales bacterium]
MHGLHDVQRVIRDALITGAAPATSLALTGGPKPATRLEVHQRHYRASLVTTLLTRFPGLVWLLGSTPVGELATAFVRGHPPAAPCLAEYGAAFPAFVAARLGRDDMGYVADFGALEWRVGTVSVAVTRATLPLAEVARAGAAVAQATLVLQPGLHYLRTSWPVHDLFRHFVGDTAPDTYDIRPAETWLEIRGARGTFTFASLPFPVWTFRRALQAGSRLEDAAGQALALHAHFDPGAALAEVISAGLVTGLLHLTERTSR